MVRIRPARLSDASAIADIQVETWRDTYAGLIPDRTLLGLSRTSHIESWRRILRDTRADTITRVAEGADCLRRRLCQCRPFAPDEPVL